ncbi:MAG: acyltransferase family protein, partial [Ginsengibacter sp.]
FIGRVGIYGVSIFFVLSGLTLYYIYAGDLFGWSHIGDFFYKRFFRIFPLFWLATLLTVFINGYPGEKILALNLTGVFGLVAWDKYIATGAWSIGNELVYYMLFPLLIFFTRKRFAFYLLSAIFLAIYVYFAFSVLTKKSGLADAWTDYVNPFNQAFLFVAGILIGHILKKVKINPVFCIGLILTGLVLFILLPASGDLINIVTGYNRLLFTACCILICIGFYKIQFPHFEPLELLGKGSYSVYLLHPLIYNGIGVHIKTEWIRFALCIVITLIISSLVYKFVEKPFMRFSHRNRKWNLQTVPK